MMRIGWRGVLLAQEKHQIALTDISFNLPIVRPNGWLRFFCDLKQYYATVLSSYENPFSYAADFKTFKEYFCSKFAAIWSVR
ncbi:hypothetical protein SAMN02745220_03114 [Desulfopila aestuarii DSM 18488]|uniref:Uncharacterized protein n=1 Tax=Desulfopila aestuarii DSM 18488 TaxID=1121416 RepID=A0A1M7YBC8_9BACT|nr:hypothetical protein SAMN02745220_03114 [Desulfopila aestuarii DSM 18488]